MHLASTSGDCTVKLWSFEKARCIHTFADHTQVLMYNAFSPKKILAPSLRQIDVVFTVVLHN